MTTDELGYDEGDKAKYDDLTRKRNSPFFGRKYTDIFVFAMALAVMKGLAPMRLKKKIPNIPLSALMNTEMGNRVWILNALAISKKSTHRVLYDKEDVFKTCEEYANAGVKYLYEEVFNRPGDIYKKIESWLAEFK